ncbi:MAG: DUF4157 domain-containing protein [Acidobacteriaceae bacterium]|nr:DUF4157 domain-containing protein [Acidobacteriaceae bacterium]MBV9763245.1 DUF4157 domain-containing protein [Acidobacteriaceae bacterium]
MSVRLSAQFPDQSRESTNEAGSPSGAVPTGLRWSFREMSMFPVQAKLRIGSTDDPLEQEANRLAERVMRMPNSRECAACQKAALREEEEDEPREKVARAEWSGPSKRAEAPVPFGVRDALQERGYPLSPAARAFFEPRFQYDFSKVRIHAGARAAEAAGSINALAFTAGHHIVFGRNQFGPATAEGGRLLAHELAHVRQQTSDQPHHVLEAGNEQGIVRRQKADSFPPPGPVPGPQKTGFGQRDTEEEACKAARADCRAQAQCPPTHTLQFDQSCTCAAFGGLFVCSIGCRCA